MSDTTLAAMFVGAHARSARTPTGPCSRRTSDRGRACDPPRGFATAPGVALAVGSEAPDFDVSRAAGGRVAPHQAQRATRAQERGAVLLPARLHAGLHERGLRFPRLYEELLGRDTEVIGVSVDDDASHDKFAGKHGVTFPLVADPQRVLARAYGATSWLRELMGGASRITYVIDKQGKIAAVLKSEISAQQHLKGARAALAALG